MKSPIWFNSQNSKHHLRLKAPISSQDQLDGPASSVTLLALSPSCAFRYPSDRSWESGRGGQEASHMSRTNVSRCWSLPAMGHLQMIKAVATTATHCGSFQRPQGNKCRCNSCNLHGSEDAFPSIWTFLFAPTSPRTWLSTPPWALLASPGRRPGWDFKCFCSVYIWSGRNTMTSFPPLLVVVHLPPQSGGTCQAL